MRRDRQGRRRSMLVLVIAAAVLCSLAGASSASAVGCNGDRKLCDRHFNRVVLPATHNSMSAQSLGWSIPNQQVGIPEQLRAGVRGFLIDTYYAHREPSGTVVADPVRTPQSSLYVCHVACQIGATPLQDVLTSMRTFLERNPRNVLVIVNEDSISAADFAAAIPTGLRRHVWRGRTGPRWPTLREDDPASAASWCCSRSATRAPCPGTTRPTGHRPGDRIQLAHRGAADRSGALAGKLRAQPWRHQRVAVPHEPLVAAGGPHSGRLGGRECDPTCSWAGRARAASARGLMPTLVAVDMFQSGGLFRAVRRLNADLTR